MDLTGKIIAIGGNARSGKDTLADNLVNILKDLDIKAQKVSFASALRHSVDDFLLKELGISAFTEKKEEKDIIRPFLVFWGTDIMRNQDQEVWIKIKECWVVAISWDQASQQMQQEYILLKKQVMKKVG